MATGLNKGTACEVETKKCLIVEGERSEYADGRLADLVNALEDKLAPLCRPEYNDESCDPEGPWFGSGAAKRLLEHANRLVRSADRLETLLSRLDF